MSDVRAHRNPPPAPQHRGSPTSWCDPQGDTFSGVSPSSASSKNSRFGREIAGRLFPFEAWLSLLHEGFGALAHVLGGGEKAEVSFLEQQRLIQRHVGAHVHGLQAGANGEGTVGQNRS